MIVGTVSLWGSLAWKGNRQPLSNWEPSVHLFKQDCFSLIPLLRTNKYQVSRVATSEGLELSAVTVKTLHYQTVWSSSLHSLYPPTPNSPHPAVFTIYRTESAFSSSDPLPNYLRHSWQLESQLLSKVQVKTCFPYGAFPSSQKDSSPWTSGLSISGELVGDSLWCGLSVWFGM